MSNIVQNKKILLLGIYITSFFYILLAVTFLKSMAYLPLMNIEWTGLLFDVNKGFVWFVVFVFLSALYYFKVIKTSVLSEQGKKRALLFLCLYLVVSLVIYYFGYKFMYQRAVDYTNKNWIDLREHYAQYDEYCIPPNDTWRGVLLLLFLSYIIPAFVFLASMMKKRVISVVDESKQSVVRRRSIALFFFFYSFALVYVGADLKDLFFTKLWCFFTIPLLIWQILSFCWRRLTPKLFWVANGVFMFVILILLMAEFFFRSKNYISEGLVSGWSVLAVLMGAFHIIAFIISIVLLVVVCIKLYFETKEKETDGVTM